MVSSSNSSTGTRRRTPCNPIRTIVVATAIAIVATTASAQTDRSVDIAVDGANKDPNQISITVGLNTAATDGPDLDSHDRAPMAPPPGGPSGEFRSRVQFIFGDGFLIADYKPFNVTQSWALQLEFGDASMTGASNTDITLTWEEDDGSNRFAGLGYGDVQLEDDGTTVDMLAVTQHTFSATPGEETRTVTITVSDIAIPIANDDTLLLLQGSSAVASPVLTNDLGAAGKGLAVIDIPKNGTRGAAAISGDMLQVFYTPSNANQFGTDTFTYTVSDGTLTATATVNVAIHQVMFERGLSATVAGDQPLNVDVTISYHESVNHLKLILTESFPAFDKDPGHYMIASAAGPGGLAVSGTIPHEVMSDATAGTAAFTWDPAGAGGLPASPFTVSYQLQTNTGDCDEKTISGRLDYGSGSNLVPTITDTFRPATQDFHDADGNHNSRISAIEYLLFAGPVADVFQKGASGKYCYDGTTLVPDTTGSDCPQQQVFHPADAMPANGAISAIEFLIYTGPVADVFQKGASGAYIFGCDGLAPSLVVP